jgi:hypothetical protein
MRKQIVAVAVGGIWLAAISSAAVLVYALNRPPVLSADARAPRPAKMLEMRPGRPAAETVESSVLEIPTVTIVGYLSPPATPASSTRRGVAEMQPPDELIIGPGVVTHPK